MKNSILNKVQKAARYTGGELGSVIKNKDEVDIRFAFCFPDVYEVGMSHLGLKILYHQLNERADSWVERVFAPWEDMETLMRENNIPLFALESKDPIKEFDFVGFTLQYEMCYTNVINMLELGGIPILSSERGENDPFVCCGGPCTYNPEPLADFVDFFIIGEGEEVNSEVFDVYKEWKHSGGTREDFLKSVVKIQGIYVPSFYNVEYNDDETVKSYTPKYDFVPKTVKKRIIEDMDSVYYPDRFIVPYMDIVHDRIMLELFRGCIRGCRFCQAGMIYRPVRERSPERLTFLADKLLKNTGYEEISLTSLSSSDYTCIEKLTLDLLRKTKEKRVNLALPSLRVDNFSKELMDEIQSVRKSSLTFAPEAGTQRMRNVINKNVTEDDVFKTARMAFEGGHSTIKLYFMIGLPTETLEDVGGIAELAEKVVSIYYDVSRERRLNRGKVTVSVSSFVPKPMTPFQWEKQDSLAEIQEKQQYLRNCIKSRMINYNYHESYVSVLEGIFARGDRRLGKVLLNAHKNGCKFDGWDEFFDFDKWTNAFETVGINPDFYVARKRSFDEILPWDIIDCGVTKEFLKRECENAYKEKTTPNCREKCSGCGQQQVCPIAGGAKK